LIFLNFLWQNDWIFNNSHTINPNNMESPSCTPIYKRLSSNTSCAMGGTWFGWSQHDKQNKLPSLIDRFFYCPLFQFIFIFLLVMVFSFVVQCFFFSPFLWCHQKLDHAQEEWSKLILYMRFPELVFYNLENLGFFLFMQNLLHTSKCHFLGLKMAKRQPQ